MTNSANTPDTSALVLHYSGLIAGAEWDKDIAMGSLRSACAQAQQAGLDLDALKAARAITKKKKPEQVVAAEKALGNTILYLRILNPEAFSQVNIEDYLRDMSDSLSGDQALFDEGRRAALQGAHNHAPAGYNDTQREHWDAGWRQGNQEAQTIRDMAAQLDADNADDGLDDDIPDDDVPGESDDNVVGLPAAG